jgi:hypothetical protein
MGRFKQSAAQQMRRVKRRRSMADKTFWETLKAEGDAGMGMVRALICNADT